MIPTRFRHAEGACDLGYDEGCLKPTDGPQGVWWLGFFAALFGFGLWFWRRPGPLEK
jgi:hypothetical protein